MIQKIFAIIRINKRNTSDSKIVIAYYDKIEAMKHRKELTNNASSVFQYRIDTISLIGDENEMDN